MVIDSSREIESSWEIEIDSLWENFASLVGASYLTNVFKYDAPKIRRGGQKTRRAIRQVAGIQV